VDDNYWIEFQPLDNNYFNVEIIMTQLRAFSSHSFDQLAITSFKSEENALVDDDPFTYVL
jgi:hypothetical protein